MDVSLLQQMLLGALLGLRQCQGKRVGEWDLTCSGHHLRHHLCHVCAE